VNTDLPEDYYRISVGIPFLDHLLTSLKQRFSESIQQACKISQLLPAKICNSDCDFSALYAIYADDLPSPATFSTELVRWKKVWSTKKDTERPGDVLSTLEKTSSEFYPNVHTLLVIFVTMAVTVAECERSFSALRRLKTYLRTTTGQDRLVGLALLNIHHDVPVQPAEVARRFMAVETRRIRK
jgi:hypothetical protein